MKKRGIAFALMLCLALTLATPAWAAGNSGSITERNTLSGDYYIKTDGTLWKLSDQSTGRPVKIASGIRSVHADANLQAVVKTDGTIVSNFKKSRGDPNAPWSVDAPYQEKPRVGNATYVSCGSNNMGVVTKDGVLWMWGRVPNPYTEGPYQNYDTIDTDVPEFKDPYGNKALRVMDNVAAFCANQEFTAAIRTDGTLWTWGRSDFGALGNGGIQDKTGVFIKWVRTPAKILDHVTQVSLGRTFGAAITADGSLYVWGSNSAGQQGNGQSGDGTIDMKTRQYTPGNEVLRPVKRMENVVRVACYEDNIAAITADGSLYVWGESYRGVVGNGSTWLVTTPAKVMDGVVDVSFIPGGVSRGTLALKRDGTLWAWGKASLLGQGKDFAGNDEVHVRGTMFTDGERLQTVPIQVAEGVALPSYCTPSNWAKADVEAAVNEGLVPEKLRSSYTQSATRSEFCALAAALYEKELGEIAERKTFSDTQDASVEKMAALGVVNGVGGGKFSPDAKLTREQAATMLARLGEVMGRPIPAREPAFADGGSISSWAKAAVGQMQQSGVMNGVGGNKFSPAGEYTREQSIVTMLRMLSYLKG